MHAKRTATSVSVFTHVAIQHFGLYYISKINALAASNVHCIAQYLPVIYQHRLQHKRVQP